MTIDQINAALREWLMDSAEKFQPGDFQRFINAALSDLSRVRPLQTLGELTLVADQAIYDSPADLIRPLYSNWGLEKMRSSNPWDSDWIGRLPKISMVVQAGARQLILEPAPSQFQIDIIGREYSYRYSTTYILGATEPESNIPEASRELLLVRAMAAAMLALANRGVTKPVITGKAGIGGMTKNGSPATLAEQYLELFEHLAA